VQRLESLLLSPMTVSTESASQISEPPYLQSALQEIQHSGMLRLNTVTVKKIQLSYCKTDSPQCNEEKRFTTVTVTEMHRSYCKRYSTQGNK